MKHTFILVLVLFVAGCTVQPDLTITNFEECIAAGNPAMESYPRQCAANGQTFVEEIELDVHTCTDSEKANKMCTRDYRPVCGFVPNGVACVATPCASFDAITFGNGCTACADQAIEYHDRACENIEFVVCKETTTGFSAEEYAESVGGVCVDICPGNYDSFVTQIGVEVCIKQYDVEEISTWEICSASSESCACVNAYETTDNVEITNAEYRCVPKDYEDRLLFRGGIDKLDENGEQSVMIA